MAGQSDAHEVNVSIFTGGSGNVTSSVAFGNVILGQPFVGISSDENFRYGFFYTIRDYVTPFIAYTLHSDTNNSFINRNYILMNFSYTELNNETLMIVNGSTNFTGVNAFNTSFFFNFTNLPDRNYTFYGFIRDFWGNNNRTVNRTVVVDTTFPAITLSSPVNNTVVDSAIVTFSYTPRDLYLQNCSLSFDNVIINETNQTSPVNGSLNSIVYNTGKQTGDTPIWAVACYDIAGNRGYSENRTLRFDIAHSAGGVVSPTAPSSGSSTGTISNRSLTNMEITYDTIFKQGAYSGVVVNTVDETGALISIENLIVEFDNDSDFEVINKHTLKSGITRFDVFTNLDAEVGMRWFNITTERKDRSLTKRIEFELIHRFTKLAVIERKTVKFNETFPVTVAEEPSDHAIFRFRSFVGKNMFLWIIASLVFLAVLAAFAVFIYGKIREPTK